MYLCTNKIKNWKQINYRNVDTMLSVQFIYDLYDQYSSDINWFRFKNVCLYYQDNKLWSYTPQKDWENALFNISNQFKNPQKYSNPNIIEKCYWYYNRRETLLDDFLEKLQKNDLNKLSNAELYEILFNWYQITLNQIYYINLAPVELGLQKAINDLNPLQYINADEVTTLYSLEDNTAVIKEELAFLKALYNAESLDIDKLIDDHLKEYDYITIGYGSKPLSRSVVVERYNKLKNLSKDEIKSKIDEIETYPNRIVTQKQSVYKKLNNSQLSELFDLAAKLGIMRDRKKALLGKSVRYRNTILDEIKNRFPELNQDFKFYIMDDFYNLLVLNEKLDKEEVEKRKEGVYISNVSLIYSGMESREEYYNNLKINEDDVSVLKNKKGVCASSGKVTGKARICLTFEESNKLKEGEILVTYGTDFDFMNAIVKSKAIVTEEGGILSHASVISRELKKPCIIAFKGITNILKNGDLIEVDATNGTIRLLEEKESQKINNKLYEGIYLFEEDVDMNEVGNKAYNLSLMKRQGLNIPEAYFLGKKFFKAILKESNQLDEYMKCGTDLNKYKDEILDIIDKVEIPSSIFEDILDFSNNTYAVRSSSSNEDKENKSFAGQYVTELFCSTSDFLIKSIRKCWKSLLGFGLEKYQDEDSDNLFGGIVIQRMINADYAGVMFTKDPVTNNRDSIIIECCKGVASKLVDNRVIPDRFFVDQETLEITDQINQDGIPIDNITKIGEIGKKLEDYYNCDVDVEWACENDTLYLIQCRPITT